MKFSRSVLYLFFVSGIIVSAVIAQLPQSPQQKFKSIHQIEWEQHKGFVPKQLPPLFKGTPVKLQPRVNPPSKEIFGYLPFWMYPNYPNLNYDLLTTIAYFAAEMDDRGNLTNLHNWPAAGLVNMAHSKGVRVVLTAINFEPPSIASVLSDPTRRSRLINNLLNEVKRAHADGVNIDFEGVPGDQRINLLTFMTELTDTFHAQIPGSFVTIFTPAVDWNDAFDYFSLAQVTDGLVIGGYDYHWKTGPTAGPVAPLTGNRWGFFSVTWTLGDYLTKTAGNVEKLILGVPFYGFEWPTVSDALEAQTTDVGTTLFYNKAYVNAQQYGRLWDQESQTTWYKYNDGQWHQGWYDDSLSLALKFNLVKEKNLKGIGIWALTYDGERPELQGAMASAFGANSAPLKPLSFYVVNIGDGRVKISVQPATGATGYKIYQSFDAQNFKGTIYPGATNILANLSMDSTYYFKISAVNGNGESQTTEVLAVKPSLQKVNVLIVNGFDRISGTINTFDFIKRFAPSVTKQGYAFDSASNEAVENSTIKLTDYQIVLWISGEEGTATQSFSPIEQNKIAEFLENGGQLFVSGSEIGYDLIEKGNSADKAFYRTYLKAIYVRDDTRVHSAVGTVDGIFANLTITFDNGTHGTYDVDFPDGIQPADGALMNLIYKGVNPNTSGGAGIQYEGIFGNGSKIGKLVYLGFPFETIYPESSRDQVMKAVLEFFQGIATVVEASSGDALPGEFELAQNYPNPFNPSTTIEFTLKNSTSQRVRLTIYNLLGQEVVTLVDEKRPAGSYLVRWDGRDKSGKLVPSGVYLYRLQVGNQIKSRKMSFIR